MPRENEPKVTVEEGLTRLSTSSPCNTSLRTCDTIRLLVVSRSCCRVLASRTQAWYRASASCAWGNQGREGLSRLELESGSGQTLGNPDTVFQTLACASSRERRLRSCCLLDPGDAWGGGSSGDPWERAFRSSLRWIYWSWERRSACTASFLEAIRGP